MMSRKTWKKALTALEMLPLIAATGLAPGFIAYAQDSAPKAPDTHVASPSPSPSSSASPAPSPSSSASPQPSPSASGTPESYVRDGEYDLTFKQAHEAVRGLRLKVTRSDKNDPSSAITSVELQGKVYNECKDDFSIVGTTDPNSKGAFGFFIKDNGRGYDCIKKQKNRPCTNNSCTTLAEKFGDSTFLDLSSANTPDGDIQLLHVNQDTGGEPEGENIGEAVKFESVKTLQARAREEADKQRLARIEKNKDLFKSCQSSLEDLKVATRALNDLIHDSGVAAEDIKSMRDELSKAREDLKKKKVAAEFKALQKRIAKLKDLGDVEDLSQAISDFADAHPDDEDGKGGYSKAAQRAQKDLINKIEEIGGSSPESFAAEKQVYQTLMGMDDVSTADIKSYRVAMTGLDIRQQTTNFQSGNFGWNEYSSFMGGTNSTLLKEARADYMSACSSTRANAMANACMQAMNNLKAAQMMPAAAMSAMQQQYTQELQDQRQQMVMQYQMQSQLNQYMGSVMNQGVQGAQMPNFMGAGSGFSSNMGANANAGWGGNSGWGGNRGLPNMAGVNSSGPMMGQRVFN